MLKVVKRREVDLILFTKLDRWSRDPKYFYKLQEILDENNVHFVAVWEPNHDSTTRAGQLLVGIMVEVGKFEAEKASERVSDAFDLKSEKGETLSAREAYGYKVVNKHTVIDQETAPNVRKVFEFVADGGSVCKARDMLASKGHVLTNTGTRDLLSNPKYIGIRTCKNRRKGTTYTQEGFCEPIISKELFYKVQDRLALNQPKTKTRDYLFNGLIRCGECGKPLSARFKNFKHKSVKTGEVTLYPHCYYECLGSKKGRRVAACPNRRQIAEKRLESYLLDNIETVFEMKIKAQQVEKPEPLQEKLASLKEELRRVSRIYKNSGMTDEEYDADVERIQRETAEITARLKEPDLFMDKMERLTVAFNNENWKSNYQVLTMVDKRAFWFDIINRIVLNVDGSIDVFF